MRRLNDGVLVSAHGVPTERFDHVFFACHADQALRLLADPSAGEREILGALPFQRNEAVLHTDTSLLPRRRLAWAAWNYHVLPDAGQRVALTYNMNILQGLELAPHVLRHAEPQRGHRSAPRAEAAELRPSDVHAGRRCRAAAPSRDQRRAAHRTIAAPIGATASTKTAWSARSPRCNASNKVPTMHSAIYRGWLEHRRWAPRRHAFRYPLFMVYLDLAELDHVFAGRWLWSTRRPALGALRSRATTSAIRRSRWTSRCASSCTSAPAGARKGRSGC